jgi:hypothetical protein
MTAMRVAVYLRQSNVRDGNQLAVSRQRDECVKLCEAKGWTTTVYVDNDISATNGKVRRTERELARLRRELKDVTSAPAQPSTDSARHPQHGEEGQDDDHGAP